MGTLQPLIQTFVNYFWPEEDDAIRSYVSRAIEGGLEDRDGSRDGSSTEACLQSILDDVADFLPRNSLNATVREFRTALNQLIDSLAETNTSKDQHQALPYFWMINTPASIQTDPPPRPSSPPLLPSPTVASSCMLPSTALQASATEFVPGERKGNVPISATDLSQGFSHALHITHGKDAAIKNDKNSVSWPSPCRDDDADDYENYAWCISYNDDALYYETAAVDDSVILSLLSQQFPGYSIASLKTIYEQQGSDFASTVQVLSSMENEFQYQQHQDHARDVVQRGSSTHTKKFDLQHEEFPSLGRPGPGTAALLINNTHSSSSNGKNSSSNSVPWLSDGYASKVKHAASLPTSSQQQQRGEYGRSVNVVERQGASQGMASHSSAPAPIWESQGIQKYETGLSIAEQYRDLRQDARDHARLRNQCFQQATQAFLAGNKALAKELGQKGRMHNETMHALHAEAAKEIFQQRNRSLVSSHSTGSTNAIPILDLHGLHVREAIHHLDEAIQKLRKQSRGAPTLRVVVGVGQHGSVPSRLPSSVKNALNEWGLMHREVYAGLLEVKLT